MLTRRHRREVGEVREALAFAELQRVAAQRGLVPYVAAVEALNAWLKDRPEVEAVVAPILQELGLYGVRVGYDPNREVALSVIGRFTHKAL